MDKEEILSLPDQQFLDWCYKRDKSLKKLINNNPEMIHTLKFLVSKYYHSKEKVDIIENKNPNIPIQIKNKNHSIFIEQPDAKVEINKPIKYKHTYGDEKIKLDKNWIEENNKLLKENGQILQEYTYLYDRIINYHLRSGEMSNLSKEIVDNMVSLLDQSKPYPKRICLYRGITDEYVNKVLSKLKEGDILLDRGFSSQTISKEVALDFADSSIMVLCYPKNTKFLYLPIISATPEEKEVLTYPNLQLKFIKKDIDIDVYVFNVLSYDRSYIDNIKINENFDPKFLTYLDELILEIKNDEDAYETDRDKRGVFFSYEYGLLSLWGKHYLKGCEDCETEIDYKTIIPNKKYYGKKSYINFYLEYVIKKINKLYPKDFPAKTVKEYNEIFGEKYGELNNNLTLQGGIFLDLDH